MAEKNIKHLNALSRWLFFCSATVFVMIIIGAITRLSGSGLSMVEWRPLVGTIPPLNEQEWLRVFELYKASPEFQHKNYWMGVHDFKVIFFWEWFHRLLGRMIGMFYGLPLAFFWVKGWIPKQYKPVLLLALFLGAAQGFMGWYMVKSGLVNEPAVSHYRLTAHLSLALLIYVYLMWFGLTLHKSGRRLSAGLYDRGLFKHAAVTFCVLALTIFWGAYTAGLDAGLIYNDTYPKMGSTWIPEEIWSFNPIWLSILESHAGVQFMHRWLAALTLIAVFSFVFHAMKKKRTALCFPMVGIVVLIQFGLGLATLLSGIHLHIAVTHQGGAVLLITALLFCIHDMAFKPIEERPINV